MADLGRFLGRRAGARRRRALTRPGEQARGGRPPPGGGPGGWCPGGALDQVGEAAGLLGLLLQGRALEGGEQDHLGGGAGVLDQAGGVEAAEDRHAQVHQDHVGLQLLGQRDRVGAVGGLAGHVEAGLDEQLDQGLPEHGWSSTTSTRGRLTLPTSTRPGRRSTRQHVGSAVDHVGRACWTRNRPSPSAAEADRRRRAWTCPSEVGASRRSWPYLGLVDAAEQPAAVAAERGPGRPRGGGRRARRHPRHEGRLCAGLGPDQGRQETTTANRTRPRRTTRTPDRRSIVTTRPSRRPGRPRRTGPGAAGAGRRCGSPRG